MTRTLGQVVVFGAVAMGCCLFPTSLQAQNKDFPGYLGVYVQESDEGMEITGFIKKTPAAKLANQGAISVGDTIVKLIGKRTRSLAELKQHRNSIPYGKEGKMLLRNSDDEYYYVWISRNRPVVAAGPGATAGAPDGITRGAPGKGEDVPDLRDIGDGDDKPQDDDDSNLRDK